MELKLPEYTFENGFKLSSDLVEYFTNELALGKSFYFSWSLKRLRFDKIVEVMKKKDGLMKLYRIRNNAVFIVDAYPPSRCWGLNFDNIIFVNNDIVFGKDCVANLEQNRQKIISQSHANTRFFHLTPEYLVALFKMIQIKNKGGL